MELSNDPTLSCRLEYFTFTTFTFTLFYLLTSLLYVDMAGKGKNKFAEVVRAVRKGKTTVGTSDPPLKRARWVEEIVVLPPSPSPPTIEEQTITQPESSSRGTPSIPPNQTEPQHGEAGTEAP